MANLLTYAGPLLVVLGLILLITGISAEAGALLAVLGFVLWLRRLRHRRPPELASATNLELKDPASIQKLMDDYWATRAKDEKQQRAQLWERAPTDARAAKELRQRILADLKLNRAARTDFGRQDESLELLGEVDAHLQQQLEQVDAIIRSLSLPP